MLVIAFVTFYISEMEKKSCEDDSFSEKFVFNINDSFDPDEDDDEYDDDDEVVSSDTDGSDESDGDGSEDGLTKRILLSKLKGMPCCCGCTAIVLTEENMCLVTGKPVKPWCFAPDEVQPPVAIREVIF